MPKRTNYYRVKGSALKLSQLVGVQHTFHTEGRGFQADKSSHKHVGPQTDRYPRQREKHRPQKRQVTKNRRQKDKIQHRQLSTSRKTIG